MSDSIFEAEGRRLPVIENNSDDVTLVGNDYGGNCVPLEDSTKQYIAEIKKIPLLAREEVQELAYGIRYGVQASEERERLIETGDIVDSSKLEGLDKLIAEGRAAHGKLVCSNLRLVVWVANKYKDKGLEPLELYQEGNIGLMRAADKFDPDKGFAFSTYATWWIRQFITRAIVDKADAIRKPAHLVGKIKAVYSAAGDLKGDKDQDPTDEEIADYLGGRLALDGITAIRQLPKRPLSLDERLTNGSDNESDTTLGDAIADPCAKGTEEAALDNVPVINKEVLYELAGLSDREIKIFEARYGLGEDERPHILAEIGRAHGITRERVRQIVKEISGKLTDVLMQSPSNLLSEEQQEAYVRTFHANSRKRKSPQ